MRVVRKIKYPELDGTPMLVDNEYPVHYMQAGDSVRAGFEKGTLKKATFELTNGHVISYEAKEE